MAIHTKGPTALPAATPPTTPGVSSSREEADSRTYTPVVDELPPSMTLQRKVSMLRMTDGGGPRVQRGDESGSGLSGQDSAQLMSELSGADEFSLVTQSSGNFELDPQKVASFVEKNPPIRFEQQTISNLKEDEIAIRFFNKSGRPVYAVYPKSSQEQMIAELEQPYTPDTDGSPAGSEAAPSGDPTDPEVLKQRQYYGNTRFPPGAKFASSVWAGYNSPGSEYKRLVDSGQTFWVDFTLSDDGKAPKYQVIPKEISRQFTNKVIAKDAIPVADKSEESDSQGKILKGKASDAEALSGEYFIYTDPHSGLAGENLQDPVTYFIPKDPQFGYLEKMQDASTKMFAELDGQLHDFYGSGYPERDSDPYEERYTGLQLGREASIIMYDGAGENGISTSSIDNMASGEHATDSARVEYERAWESRIKELIDEGVLEPVRATSHDRAGIYYKKGVVVDGKTEYMFKVKEGKEPAFQKAAAEMVEKSAELTNTAAKESKTSDANQSKNRMMRALALIFTHWKIKHPQDGGVDIGGKDGKFSLEDLEDFALSSNEHNGDAGKNRKLFEGDKNFIWHDIKLAVSIFAVPQGKTGEMQMPKGMEEVLGASTLFAAAESSAGKQDGKLSSGDLREFLGSEKIRSYFIDNGMGEIVTDFAWWFGGRDAEGNKSNSGNPKDFSGGNPKKHPGVVNGSSYLKPDANPNDMFKSNGEISNKETYKNGGPSK